VEQIFEILILKFLANLALVSAAVAAVLSRPTDLATWILSCNWFYYRITSALVEVISNRPMNWSVRHYAICPTGRRKKLFRNLMTLWLVCCALQDMVAKMCTDYFQRYRRQTHVTPKSYLSFIAGYKAIYDAKRSEIGQLAQRMNTGLQKLIEATESVNELSKELAVKEKELEVASNKADEVLAEVTASAQAAEAVKVQVQRVKDKAQKLVDDIAVSLLSSI